MLYVLLGQVERREIVIVCLINSQDFVYWIMDITSKPLDKINDIAHQSVATLH